MGMDAEKKKCRRKMNKSQKISTKKKLKASRCFYATCMCFFFLHFTPCVLLTQSYSCPKDPGMFMGLF